MPTAILIGFQYGVSFGNPLPGTKADLKNAISWCKSFDCDIHIFTDILSMNKSVHIEDGRSLVALIVKILNKKIIDNKLIIYYSGHGVKDSMVMPNKDLLLFTDFKDNILKILDPYTEIFWMLDCCNPSGLHLPFKLDNNSFALSSSKIQCVTQPILLIASSEEGEKAIGLQSGSLFSTKLFSLLTSINDNNNTIPNGKNRNLNRLIGNLSGAIRKISPLNSGYSQTVSVYSSYQCDPIMWMWIGSNKPYDIVTDMTLTTLIVRK